MKSRLRRGRTPIEPYGSFSFRRAPSASPRSHKHSLTSHAPSSDVEFEGHENDVGHENLFPPGPGLKAKSTMSLEEEEFFNPCKNNLRRNKYPVA